MKTFDALGMDVKLPKEELDIRIGAHFQDIFIALNIEVLDIEHFINVYKSYYFDFIDRSTFFTGIPELLDELHAQGIKIALLTTKAQDQAEIIVSHFGIASKFAYVMGRRPGIPVKPAAEPLLMICDALQINKENALLVGDTEFDTRCGKNAGIDCCAVTYGYRSLEQLQAEQPRYIIDQPKELLAIVNHSTLL
jgi:HAD superfamily hydrolase (TIGR01549 family)